MIIDSLLDTDLYKLTMQQFAFHFMPQEKKNATYALKCRSGEDLRTIKNDLEKEINSFMKLTFSEDEIFYLKSLDIFKDDYLSFLKTFSFKNCSYEIKEIENNLELRIHGPWQESILFEVPVLAMIQELHFNQIYNTKNSLDNLHKEGMKSLEDKCSLIKNSEIKFADFGSRRRFSHYWHDTVLSYLLKEVPNNIIGTSNIFLAKKYNTKPIGTMAHEFFSAMQGLDFIPIELSQKYALHQWFKEYNGKLDVALTDIFNIDSFIHDCDYDLLSKYSGFRHDSGSPYKWGERLINHFINYGFNPKDKTLVFSDGLNIPKAINIHNHFSNQCNVLFGIGTNLTNDFKSHRAMSLVMKLVNLNGNSVIKVSDEPSKITCEDPKLINNALDYLSNLKNKEHTYPNINIATDVVINNKDEVLLIKRGNSNESEFQKWALPGGFIDINESAKKAASREVEEELSLSIDEKDLRFLTYKDAVKRDPRKRTISLVFHYTLSTKSEWFFEVNDEVSDAQWFSINNLPKNIAFDHKEILKEFSDAKK